MKFNAKNEGWTAAKKLNPHKLLKSRTDATLKVTASEQITLKAPVKVYNFEVEEWHCYYVSYLNLLVHNDRSMNFYINKWAPGSNGTPFGNAKAHFEKHGEALGSKDFPHYLRQAEEFRRDLKGAKKDSRNYNRES